MVKNSNYIYRLLLVTIFMTGVLSGRAEKEDAPKIKIVAEIQKEGFVGEVLSYNVVLVSTSPEISNVKLISSPVYPENFKVIKGVVRHGRPEQFEEKGVKYYKWTILKEFIIPDKAGKFNISSSSYVAFIPHDRIIYDNFWGNYRTREYQEVKVDCKSVSFKVNELPQNKGEFSNCVGDFKIEAWFPPGKIGIGRDAYAIMTVSGFGSLENLKIPNLYKLFDKGCHLKEVEQTEERQQRDGRLYSEVTLTCTFIAEEEEFEILPLCLNFFNPQRKKYEEECSEKLHWTTTPKENSTKKSSNEAIEI